MILAWFWEESLSTVGSGFIIGFLNVIKIYNQAPFYVKGSVASDGSLSSKYLAY
jgi:hypothetical protein